MSVQPISVEDFDRRAGNGESMSEFFTQYASCDLDVDALIEEIHDEKARLERAPKASRASRARRQRAMYRAQMTRDAPQHTEVYGSDVHIMQAVQMTLTDACREAAHLNETLITDVFRAFRDDYEAFNRAGKFTYFSSEKRAFRSSIRSDATVSIGTGKVHST